FNVLVFDLTEDVLRGFAHGDVATERFLVKDRNQRRATIFVSTTTFFSKKAISEAFWQLFP
ncbi:MAG: hypothetical protein QGH53_00620, partial [Prochlorococcaceae cyanobacterium ETNP18_MAG_1]|nr:hypothetical protein [Prochlorococcaceae cyanobacterium ETNP18_MAG_1]